MSQAYDILPFFSLVLMNLCLFNFTFDIVELPPFVPNDYLFETHEAKIVRENPMQ